MAFNHIISTVKNYILLYFKFVVTLYNPLGHRYLREVRIPVTGTQYIVKDPEGYNVSSQVILYEHSVCFIEHSLASFEDQESVHM